MIKWKSENGGYAGMGDDMKGQAVRRYWMIGAAVLAVILAAGILLATVFGRQEKSTAGEACL